MKAINSVLRFIGMMTFITGVVLNFFDQDNKAMVLYAVSVTSFLIMLSVNLYKMHLLSMLSKDKQD